MEASRFLIKQFEESIVGLGGVDNEQQSSNSNSNLNNSRRFSALSHNRPINPTENSSENYFLKKEDCFRNMIQFDTKIYDSEFDVFFF
jgi:hypothetical protein